MTIGRSANTKSPAWRRMLSPLRYLAIRHTAKIAFDWGFPAILTAATLAVFILLPIRPPIVGDKGVLRQLHDLIGLLAAFFVAALAAVSTVDRKSLDAPMIGTPPILYGEALSRRRFVCMLFGYLSFVAFALYLCSIIADVFAPSLRAVVTPSWLGYLKVTLGGAYGFAFWNMSTTTMLGIWFLVDRVPTGPAPSRPSSEDLPSVAKLSDANGDPRRAGD